MPPGAGVSEVVEAPDYDIYVEKFVNFVATQGLVDNLAVADIARTTHRDEFGISSLDIILLVANYMEETGRAEMEFNPEWVVRLDDIEGIVSVLREIDRHNPNGGR